MGHNNKVIYEDSSAIAAQRRAYYSFIADAQKIIDEITAAGIVFSDDILTRLSNVNDLTALIEEQVTKEAGKMQFALSKKQYMDSVKPLYALAEQWQRRYTQAKGNCDIRNDLFSISQGHIFLFEDKVDNYLKEQHVIYLDTEAKEQVYAQAQDIVNKLEELDAYLREHGNVMRAVSRSGYLTTNGIISIGNNNEFSINLPGFRYVEKFTRR